MARAAPSSDLTRPSARQKMGLSEARMRQWREDPRVFMQDVCKIRGDRWQEKFWAALGGAHLDPFAKNRLALKACKGPGKTFALAGAGWWWLMTRWHANGIVCSITADNLRDNLWAEFARFQNRSPVLQHFFSLRGERIEAKEHPKTWWLSARSFPQNANPNQQANTIAGLHGRHPLVLLDEVGDYPDGVLVAAEAIFANKVDGRVVIAGNPTDVDGPLYRVCERDRQYWWVYEITGDPADPDCAPRVDKEENQKLIDQWGPDHPYVLVNVYGKFPPKGWNKLIGAGEYTTASMRQPDPRVYVREPLIFGFDPARSGECESVLYKRQGSAVQRARTWREGNSMLLADQVALEYEKDKPEKFFMDAGGLGGPIYDRLQELGVPVVGVDSGSNAANEKQFVDKRTEMWWTMAEWLKRKGGCLPNDAKLKTDLLAPNISMKKVNKVTKIALETKDEMKKRGVASPDHGDALALTFASPVYGTRTGTADPLEELLRNIRMGGKIIGGTEDGYDPLEGF